MSNGRKRLSWEETALKLAFNIADYRSEDLFVQVGACAIKNNGDIVLGYNGSVPKIDIDWSNREERRKRVLHAEENVLNRVLPGEVKLLAISHSPCVSCIRIIGQKLIKQVIFNIERPDFKEMLALAREFRIEIVQMDI